MSGLVIFTGANSSLGLHAARYILQKYPHHAVVFTVRDASDTDVNTATLREIIAQFPDVQATIVGLDLASLSATHGFADGIVSGIQEGRYPRVAAIVCNAYYWNLVGDPESTIDGYDKTFQVAHISHSALVLRLLGSFEDNGRVVLLSSDSHCPGKNAMEKYPPVIGNNLDVLVNPTVDDDKEGRGYQRYATAKLALTTWMHANPKLKGITATAINPGGMVDSRCLRTNTPQSMIDAQKSFYIPQLATLQLTMPTLRTAEPASKDVVALAIDPKYAGQRGYFTLLEKDESAPESLDPSAQSRLWAQTLVWSGITKDNTALSI
ncbi:hypothetical protein G7054_g7528 [Neopestalotiopsis clavispora]|nr:hypothetical protein G7054_g7528 [Neopestalotiopsis clavispora]